MKDFVTRFVPQIMVQLLAMILFMRVVHWDLYSSALMSAGVAMIFSLVIHVVQRRVAGRKTGV